MKSSHSSFDTQAQNYDLRVGLSENCCQAIAQTVLTLSQAQPSDLLVEIGAGTGMIGQWFVKSFVNYLGFDLSQEMLNIFRERLEKNNSHWTLLKSDGNDIWPVDDHSAKVIFSSRSIHLLDSEEHIINETFRIAHPQGCIFLVGNIKRDSDSIKAKMKQQMHQELALQGLAKYPKEKKLQRLTQLYRERGAKPIEPIEVYCWTVTNTPEQSLQSWQDKPGLGGIDIPPTTKQEILYKLQTWADDSLGGLTQTLESQETYVLQGFWLPPTE
ncbi:class I SAM-dependent methyltransferase [Aphanothece sacrum]|uniref:Type 11 methyltransferase n=1 Tax=Aphanothece sacrum FPU1 TaxID=1920663 RepID=A0A401IH57_APHSA|nr:class I SAM-dependent methyltransferase [Aphanothece sacrum]GBF80627.1 type 11 methyltransferase [Aphanothece sacrum FPU1]GBF83983.1 methyltransferase [Aphanothece sacrum FPU3]